MHGYSSSEESEDPRRPRAQPASNSNQDQKKKRKRRVPPQPSINRIWKKFSNRKFTKALAVLPFDPVQPPASPDRPNELLWDGYNRAAEECRRKVEKIVKECKRVNMRYRDPGFDLDWDFKYEKGHCLNSLGQVKYELNRSTLLNSSASVPKAVKRVHEVYEKPTFMSSLIANDVKQGSLGDCWFMAGLTALANVEDGIKRLCVAHNTKIGIYGFVFYRDGEWIYSIIDDKLYLKSPSWDLPSKQRDLLEQIDREDVEKHYRKTYQTGSKALFFAQNVEQNETWVPLIEKAYAKAHGDYASLSGGWIGEAFEDLSGGVTTELFTSDILDLDEFWENEMLKVNQEFLFGCSTGVMEHGYGERNGISEAHAYVVMDARTLKSGQRLVKLRNPWGKIREGLWEGPWSDGSKEWTTEVQEELGHKFGSDSVFWISFEDMIQKYSLIERTRLFRDTDWRCCQRWIGADVPWKPDYHEKFQIKLTQDSPLILTLNQLDRKYYKGLHGQYSFRLHFRLHNQDSPDAEDYIVRSHGNFLTYRSVSVELPDMPAGNYSVYVKVVGERNSKLQAVEEVVKNELKGRVENEKLAQVGYAYDLAHSKAWDHINKVARIRKRTEQSKASGHRQKERRRAWEKRHLNREASRRQDDKNKEKKQKRRDDWNEDQRKKAEAEFAAAEAAAAAAKVAEEEKAQAKSKEESDAKADPSSEVVSEKSSEDTKADDKPGQGQGSESTGSPQYTPKSEDSTIVIVASDKKQEVPPVDGSPPPVNPAPKPQEEKVEKPQKPLLKYNSDGDSSDSPVEDWDEIYSSDDMVRKPRIAPQQPPQPRDDYDTEEEKMPDPWNAVCIVGIRVYSKDANLELRTVIEGGELLEGGMGEKGAADLDNAQANAGGSRLEDKEGSSPYPSVIRRDGGLLTPGDMSAMMREYLRIDSGSSSMVNTPGAATPLEGETKRL
ncbi:unnamed protein product [Clonostachys rosea]|uniref:Calpain catalytic domain-containing protein n=1 Tax=Bionectria ochroleuca TaxID=29856 RepID=A0ABY6TTG6_BIOOC|nr:unnamed protein product [Clonostachys rosea]